MISVLYLIIFVLCIVAIKIYLPMFTKQHGIHYIAFLSLAAISSLNYYFLSIANSSEVALIAQKNIYAVMLFFPIIFFSILCELCKASHKYAQELLALLAIILAVIICTTDVTGLFYKEYKLNEMTLDISKDYGIFHSVYYSYLAISFFLTFYVIFANRNKKNIPSRLITLVVIMETVLLVSVFLGDILNVNFNFDVVGELVVDGLMIHLANRIPLYDVEESVTERIEKNHEMGVAIADKTQHLIGYNDTMLDYIPDFKNTKVDDILPDTFRYKTLLSEMADEYERTKEAVTREIQIGERWYSLEMYSLIYHHKERGYQLFVRDITEKNKYIHQLEVYRNELMEEVDSSITKIDVMKDASIVGVAELIESRDGSTGGHVKRTSDVVSIITDSLIKHQTYDVSPLFYAIVEKVASLHDVGKIAVDDAILRKPGRFTNDEFEKMKQHAASGGKIIKRILGDIEDEECLTVAGNIATFHHERWDGSGYPNNLVGSNIPLEARIMAVADVYDALVSKRCYKESFGFEKAKNIIIEGMGSQFDPALKDAFCECVPKLEEYYTRNCLMAAA